MDIWNINGNIYHKGRGAKQTQGLDLGVYEYNSDPQNGPYLIRLKDTFEFPYKVYDIQTEFIDRVVKTYKHINSNLGILLTGLKGTGKTVTAEIICASLGIPTIIVNKNCPALAAYLSEIQQHIIVLFDEFEKNFAKTAFEDGGEKLLALMDGSLKSDFKKVFLLTSNTMTINENYLERPSRIRYLKTFGNLSLDTIIQIVEDKLIHKELRDVTIDYIAKLNIVTIDIVISIVTEVNIHKENPEVFDNIFNVKKIKTLYNVSLVIEEDSNIAPVTYSRVEASNVLIPEEVEKEDYFHYLGQNFHVNGRHLGFIKDISVINPYEFEYTIRQNNLEKENVVKYRISVVQPYNNIFNKYLL